MSIFSARNYGIAQHQTVRTAEAVRAAGNMRLVVPEYLGAGRGVSACRDAEQTDLVRINAQLPRMRASIAHCRRAVAHRLIVQRRLLVRDAAGVAQDTGLKALAQQRQRVRLGIAVAAENIGAAGADDDARTACARQIFLIFAQIDLQHGGGVRAELNGFELHGNSSFI